MTHVYLHINPETAEVLYIGAGAWERAIECNPKLRSVPHARVLANLRNKGYRPTDFTVSIFEGEKSVAHSLEKRLIKKLRPVLNHMSVQPHSHTALTEQEVRDIRVKYASGAVSQGTLAKAYGVAQPTVHAIVSRRTWAHI